MTATGTKRVLRWILRLDQPMTERTPQELSAFVARHYRRNFVANLMEGVTFWLTFSLLSYSTIVPLFVLKLTTSTVAIGVAALLAQGGWFAPQLLSANLVERLPRRKPVAVHLALVLDRLPMWLLLIPAAIAGQSAGLALILFFVFFGWREVGAGFVAPALEDLLARVIPVEGRGRFWGLTAGLGALLGIGASALSAWLLTAYAYPTGFVLIFLLAAISITIGLCFLALTREPGQPVRGPRLSQRQFFASLPSLLRQDRAFRRFLGAQGILTLSAMGMAFITVAAVRHWAASDGTVAIYSAVLLFGQGTGNLVFGVLSDRRGHKLSLEFGAGLYAAAYALAMMAPDVRWFFLVFLLLGIGNGAQIVSRVLVTLEFGDAERRPTYIGLSNTTAGLVALVGPLLAAWLASIGYDLLFGVCVAVSLVALVALHWWVEDPRWAEARC
jgi:MFS family permease